MSEMDNLDKILGNLGEVGDIVGKIETLDKIGKVTNTGVSLYNLFLYHIELIEFIRQKQCCIPIEFFLNYN